MSAQHSGKSTVTGWVLLILAVPVVYVLSVAPIYHLVHSLGDLDYKFTPGWLDDYSDPYWRMYAHLPHKAQAICMHYDAWWQDMAGKL